MLEGDLGDFSIAEILQLLGFTKKTGRLQLHGPRSAGRMVVVQGGLMDVTADVARVGVVRRLLGRGHVDPAPIFGLLEDADELPSDRHVLAALVADGHLDAEVSEQLCRDHALEALAELLRWEEGSFRFEADPVLAEDLADVDGLPAEAMMEEANQRLAAWDELTSRIGPGDQVVTLAVPSTSADVTVPAAAWALLRFVDGIRTIDEVAALSGRGAYETRQGLLELVELGLVRLGDGAGDGAPDTGVSDALARVAELEAKHHPGAAVTAAAAFGKASQEDPEPSAAADQAPTTDADEPATDDVDGGDDVESDEEPTTAALSAVEDPSDDLEAASDGGAEEPAATAASSPPEESSTLRTKVRKERLRTDPSIDEDLVSRLIDGVEGL